MVEYLRLGNTGMEVSEACLGTWMFGSKSSSGSEIVPEDVALSILDSAWDQGVNFIDTANIYGRGRSELYIGRWLEGKDRQDFVLASKVFFALSGRQEIGLSRKIVKAEIEGTLDRLGTDFLDIYYIHGWHDPSPLEETLAALNDLVRVGKVHYLGVSNFAAWQLVLANEICRSNGWAPISVVQPRYNAVDHVPYTVDPAEMALPDLFDACRYLKVGVCSYSPLAEGFLTGKYKRDADGNTIKPEGSRGALSENYGQFPERWWKVLSEVEQIADEVGATPAQVAIKWVSWIKGLTSIPIIGSTSVNQINEALDYTAVSLSEAQYRRITDAGNLDDLNPHAYTYT
ncbi:MAG: aldo/keto reductase [Acidimicrobiia bacterium]|jgi:aryl-alcohol dehydrogenase-like predicted oxidoreductase